MNSLSVGTFFVLLELGKALKLLESNQGSSRQKAL